VKHRWILLLLLGLFASPAAAEDPILSGPQPGEKLTPFKVFVATGERQGKEADLIAEWDGAPAVLVFVHELTRPGAALMRALDAFQQRRAGDGLKLGFVFLTRDRTQSEQHLPLVARSLRMAAPLTLSVDGPEGPGNYGLNRHVQMTVLVARKNSATASFALVQPNETDASKIWTEVVKLIGGSVPTLDEVRATGGR